MVAMEKLSRIQLNEAAEFLVHEFDFINAVDLVVQLGSSQTPEGLLDEEWNRLPLQQMPHLPFEQSVAEHNLEIVWGTINGLRVLIYSGRYHVYEGHGRVPVVLPIWAAAECGARTFFFANAAASVNPALTPGSFVSVRDHINKLGMSPLMGLQHLLPKPYIDMSRTYDADLAASFTETGRQLGLTIHPGVYMANLGPQFETPAEVRLARMNGADVLGMSTVLEATTAHALGARVIAVSMVSIAATSVTTGVDPVGLTDDARRDAGKQLTAALRKWVIDKGQEAL